MTDSWIGRSALRRMGVLPLTGALYLMVSGGPYGLEEIAQKVGFSHSILIFLALPILWSLPTAFMVGELASSHPDEGGFYVWVRRALGPFWGFQEAWLSLAASVFDMAIYPTLFTLYLGRLFPSIHFSPVLVGVAMIAASAAYNIAGSLAVGRGSELMTLLVVLPFLVLSVFAFQHPAAAPHPAAAAPIDWSGGIVIAMWNTMGWDNASTIAGEVARPQRTYPIAVLAAVAIVTVVYVIPLGAMQIAGVDPSSWETGSWVDAARTYGGAPLAVAVVAGGVVSSFGMYNALCLSYSRVPAVLAEDGYLPSVLTKTVYANGAPWTSILACSVLWTLSLGISFERLVSLDILAYGVSLLLEFVALVVLRMREPGRPRPFKVPGGLAGVSLLGVGPTLLLAIALVKNADEKVGPINALVFGAAVVLAGFGAYAVAAWWKARREAASS